MMQSRTDLSRFSARDVQHERAVQSAASPREHGQSTVLWCERCEGAGGFICGHGPRPAERRVRARHVARGARCPREYVALPSPPCSQPSSGGSHHRCATLVHTPPRRTRKPRHRHHRRHLPNLTTVNKLFTISSRNTFKPPSCSYRTFLVRAIPTPSASFGGIICIHS
jgi:hypothetical protein